MLNRWLLYQTLACRIWARAGVLPGERRLRLPRPAAGRHGARPSPARRSRAQHLLRAAARQFVEGDVQHWWLPHSGPGRAHAHLRRPRLARLRRRALRRRDRRRRGPRRDRAVPRGPAARAPASTTPSSSRRSPTSAASLFEHCARGARPEPRAAGAHGLPLIGTGDWNDGMNRVGEGGKGESVWLGWFLLRDPRARSRRSPSARRSRRAPRRWRAHAGAAARRARARGLGRRLVPARLLRRRHAARLGRRATNAASTSIAQSWAVLSGAADPGPRRAGDGRGRRAPHPPRRRPRAALHAALRPDRRSIPATSRAIRPASARTAASTRHAAIWAVHRLRRARRRRQGRASSSRC